MDHKEYEVVRPGDGLLVPFQCDVCVFRRIRKEEPDSSSVSDRVLLMYIRRANLDVFWSRAPKTVANELGNATRNIRNISFLKLSGPYYDPGPAPSSDSCGYEAAVSLLVDSQQPGRYHDSHKQWESVRKLRSTISNFERTSFGVSQVALVADDNGSTTRFQGGGTSSYWSNRFTQGIGNRMGSDIRKNVAVSTELYVKFLNRFEDKIRMSDDEKEMGRWVIGGAYFCFSYVCSFRGEEGFLLDIKLLKEHRSLSNGLVWWPLIGKVKGDRKVRTYLLRSVPITSSGIDVEGWRNKLLRLHEFENRNHGPAICDDDGYLMSNRKMNEMLWTVMEELYTEDPDQFPKAITCLEDIPTWLQLFRFMRKTSDSRALRVGITEADINLVNRWSSEMRAKGRKPSEHLSISYSQQDILDDVYKRYSSAM